MKKYIALFDVIILLTIGYIMSINVPFPKDTASGVFSIFDALYSEEHYGDTLYIAIMPNQYEEEDLPKFVFLMRNYCLKNGHRLLVKNFDELVDEGFIVNGGFEDGIIFGLESYTASENRVYAHAYIYKGNLSSFGREFTATYADHDWTLTSPNRYWIS
ncbi:MAG: hypothetical protein CVV56_08540 [Tenericutes bacterium HGW-Tenericutes-1]|jgi:hypothetical protein|nr:MAG: hypothetical protein CVV56_08540 [Tenericutes bacterium HGW-Tenericutes-1]